MGRRVVVTGMGVVSPVGNCAEDFWLSLREGRSGIGLIDRFDPEGLRSRIAGQAEPVTPAGMSNKELSRLDPYSVVAIGAADEAWAQAGIDIEAEDPYRAGLLLGSGVGGLDTISTQAQVVKERGVRRVSPLFAPKGLCNMAGGNVAIRLGLLGPNKTVVTACASGTHALGDAARLIRWGLADVMLAGGTEAALVPLGVAGFDQLRALSCRNDEPERASRPFDLDRDGFVIAEGAGLLVLESEEHATGRGAEILGEVAGFGETCDAYHITAPRPDGAGAVAAMRLALEDAGIGLADVGYINAHGTSTRHNDASESGALRQVFGAAMPPVSSTKSMTGHLLGAAGAVEAVACLMALRDGVLPPNINYETPDPECDINVVANVAREAKIEIALSNSLGFGGHNASIVLRRYGG